MNAQPTDDSTDEASQPKPQPRAEAKGLLTLRVGLPILPSDHKTSILKMTEFKVYVDLYKFFLKLSLSVNVFYLAVLGGLLTFIFRPVENYPEKRLIDDLTVPVKSVLLITPFILSWVIMLSFGMGAWYWWISTRAINRKMKAEDVEVKLITRPFFHLLTWLLAAVAIIFMFVTFFLGWIMRDECVLFCDYCLLAPSTLPRVVGVVFAVVILSLPVIKRKYLLDKIRRGRKENRKQHVAAGLKCLYLIALVSACIFIVSTIILLRDVALVFQSTFDASTLVISSIAIFFGIVAISAIILAWKKKRKVARENEHKIAQLERKLEALGKKPDPPDKDRGKESSKGGEPVSGDT